MVILLISFIFSFCVEASSFDWILASDVDGVKTWQLKSDKMTTASLQASKFRRPDEARKKKLLQLMGFKDYVSEKKSDRIWSGHYTGPAGEKVFFREIHLDKSQLLFTSPKPVSESYNEGMLK